MAFLDGGWLFTHSDLSFTSRLIDLEDLRGKASFDNVSVWAEA
jgi:hypothetical protein